MHWECSKRYIQSNISPLYDSLGEERKADMNGISTTIMKLCMPALIAAIVQAAPTDNPIASYYSGDAGYPVWSDDIAWDNVIEMSDKGSGSANFTEFEAKRDELASKGGGVLYYPAGTYDFETPDGPNGRGLMLKAGVVIRGETPSSDKKAAKSYDNAGLSSMKTVFKFTKSAYSGPSLMNFIGCTPAVAEKVGIAWVQIESGYIHFGFDATWSSKWSSGSSWLTDKATHGWGERKPDGTHIMDPWTGDGTDGKWDSGDMTYGSKRFAFGCRMVKAKIHNYAINKADCSNFSADDESWRYGGVISLYGEHLFVANNVIQKESGSYTNRLNIDVNKAILALYQNRCDVKNGTGYYGKDVIVRDNWVYNKGNKSYEVAGSWVVVRDNIANKDYLNMTTFSSCDGNDPTADFMNRAFDLGGSQLWCHNNEFHGCGSGGNDGEGILVQRHNQVEVFSHAWTDNAGSASSKEPEKRRKGYIAPYDVHIVGMLQLRNKTTTGFVGVAKPAENHFEDIAVVKNEAKAGIEGDGSISAMTTSCPSGSPNKPQNVSVARQADGGVSITWTDKSSNEIGFRIDRKIGSGSWYTIAYRPPRSGKSSWTYTPPDGGGGGPCDCQAQMDFNPSKWMDYTAPKNKSVDYRVVAINCDDDESGASEGVSLQQSTTRHSRFDLSARAQLSVDIVPSATSLRIYCSVHDCHPVSLSIVDARGATIALRNIDPQKGFVVIEKSKLSPGVFFMRLRQGPTTLTRSFCVR